MTAILKVSPDVKINTTSDALDLIANSGTSQIILWQESLSPNFFDLKTGLAGEIMQKLVNYQVKWALVGNFENIPSKSLKAFILECNRGNTLFFAKDLREAENLLENN